MFRSGHDRVNIEAYEQLTLPFSPNYNQTSILFRKKQGDFSDITSTTSEGVKNKRDKTEKQKNRLIKITDTQKLDKKQFKDRFEVYNNIDEIRKYLSGEKILDKRGLQMLHITSKYNMYNSRQSHNLLLSLTCKNELKISDDELKHDLYYILNPPTEVKTSDFDFLLDEGRSGDAKMRYMPNVDIRSLVTMHEDLSKQIINAVNYGTKVHGLKIMTVAAKNILDYRNKGLITHKLATDWTVINGLVLMHSTLTYQLRYGSYENFILMFCTLEQKRCEKEYFSNINISSFLEKCMGVPMTGVDLAGIQYIRYIISHYGTLPFTFIDDKIIYDVIPLKISSQLAMVVISLMNMALYEFLGAFRHVDAIVGCKYILYCANVSLSNTHLNVKSKSRDWFQLILKKVNLAASHTYDDNGLPAGISFNYYGGEFGAAHINDDEIINKMEDLNPIKQWAYTMLAEHEKIILDNPTKDINELNEDDKAKLCAYTEWLRYVNISIQSLTNPGIYHKTSLAIEYHKSLETQHELNLRQPHILSQWNMGTPDVFCHDYDWYSVNNVVGRLYDLYNNVYSDDILLRALKKDFEEFFLVSLTHKSGGRKAEITDEHVSEVFGKVSNTRFTSYALESHKYDSFIELLNMLKKEQFGTIRFANDRRARIITIVSNAIQSSELFVLFAFNVIKKNVKEIAVGKQVGNMIDAVMQLRTTGNPNLMCNSSDISGMDAHTLPPLTLLLRNCISKTLEDVGNPVLAGTSGKRYNYLCMTNNNVFLDKQSTKMRYLSAYSKIIDVVNSAEKPEAILKDGMFTKEVRINKNVFPSGLYGTSAQHSTILALLIRLIREDFDKLRPGNDLKNELLVLGDDQFETLQGKEDDIREWLEVRRKLLRELNYPEEPLVSKFSGVFLQQAALLGCYVPYPARMSLFVDERSENVLKLPPDLIVMLIDQIKKIAHRCYGSENALPLMRCVWNSVRHVKVKLENSNELSSNSDIYTMNNGLLCNLIETNDTEFRVTYPYVLIFCAPISASCQNIYIEENNELINEQMSSSLRGDFSYYYLTKPFIIAKEKLDTKDEDLLFAKPKDVRYRIDWQLRHSYGFTISEYILQYNRQGQRIELIRNDDKKMAYIRGLARRLIPKLNSYKLLTSVQARDKLIAEFGESFSGRALGYDQLPLERLIEALGTTSEDEILEGILTEAFFSFLRKYTIVPKKMNKIIAGLITVLNCNSSVESCHMSYAGLLNYQLAFMPMMYRGSDHAILLLYTDVPTRFFGKHQVNRLNAINSELHGSVDIDTLVRISIELYRKKQEADVILQFASYVGLSKNIGLRLAEITQEVYEHGYSNTYLTIFDKSTMFFITDSSMPSYDNCNIITHNHININKDYLKLLSRDVIHSYCRRFCKESNAPVIINVSSYVSHISAYKSCGYTLYKPTILLSNATALQYAR